MKEKIQRFMIGRYGVDDFSKFLLGFSIITLAISMLTGSSFINLIAIALVAYTYFRILSKDFSKRYAENYKFLNLKNRALNITRKNKMKFDQRADFKFFRCPKCNQEVRVPKGKGSITITCPKCKAKFDKVS